MIIAGNYTTVSKIFNFYSYNPNILIYDLFFVQEIGIIKVEPNREAADLRAVVSYDRGFSLFQFDVLPSSKIKWWAPEEPNIKIINPSKIDRIMQKYITNLLLYKAKITKWVSEGNDSIIMIHEFGHFLKFPDYDKEGSNKSKIDGIMHRESYNDTPSKKLDQHCIDYFKSHLGK